MSSPAIATTEHPTSDFDSSHLSELLPSFMSSATTIITRDGTTATAHCPRLPSKTLPPLIRRLRHKWLTVYRRLSILCLLPNVLCMVVLGILGRPRLLQLPLSALAIAVTANFLAAILIRQELVINLLFILFGHCPQWMPLRIRRLSAKIYHLGGVHSGAAVAGTVWFGILSFAIFKSQNLHASLRAAILSITGVLDMLMVAIVATAEPHFRRRFHDQFEWCHRFAGWTVIVLFWALFILLTTATRATADDRTFSALLIRSPVFYMLIIITVCLIAPWVNLRRVSVRVEPLSDHAVRLHFEYTNVPLCSAPRITDNPLREWHAFASIPDETGTGFSVIVSRAGDWTGRMIRDPPQYLYKRGWLARGVLNVAPIFKSMVIICTGSGIGPVLSLLKGAPNLEGLRLLWSTKNPQRTYKKEILDDVFAADPNAVVIDTSISPRPNLCELGYKLYDDSKAEAVFVISNPIVTREVVYELESRGIPTFAPIFDS